MTRKRAVAPLWPFGIAVGSIAALGVGVTAFLTAYFARVVITPPRSRPEDVRVLHVGPATVTLSATLDSLTPGEYSLWFDGDLGHARIGEIISFTSETVTRVLLGVDFGDLTKAHSARFSGWVFLQPGDLDVPWSEVDIDTELGPAPAWVIPAGGPTRRWVIQVHGRAVRRQEALRAIPVFRASGYTSLIVSYRNDGDAPQSRDHRYSLGDTEWRDVEAAMRYARAHGAQELVLMGWSMGGATVLQALTRSDPADDIIGVVLDSPVVDWVTALQFQGRINRLPRPIGRAALRLLSSSWGGFITGLDQPINLTRLDFVARARELAVPILLLHSEDDGFVPATASELLARARPDIVTFEHFDTARHTKLWNYDRLRWESAITRWLAKLP